MRVGQGLSYIESLPSAPQEKEEDSAMDNPVAESSVILYSYVPAVLMQETPSRDVKNSVLHCKKLYFATVLASCWQSADYEYGFSPLVMGCQSSAIWSATYLCRA